ncbi:unnamed protein product [Microthlaspi erraticum]|uniref:Uncharacterized protein n=1 Tax=Microthlaspi erraticum TaxID=1685480 RepID=A0A6D2IH32_9BRAS|nr:unnamed protein product [Microthlaspi erraticum]
MSPSISLDSPSSQPGAKMDGTEGFKRICAEECLCVLCYLLLSSSSSSSDSSLWNFLRIVQSPFFIILYV